MAQGRAIAMLYLDRELGEAVMVDLEIEGRGIALAGETVKLGFPFPAEASVLREEAVDRAGDPGRRHDRPGAEVVGARRAEAPEPPDG